MNNQTIRPFVVSLGFPASQLLLPSIICFAIAAYYLPQLG